VNKEIALVLRMASSSIIQQYFLSPSDANLEQKAFAEIDSYRKAFIGNTIFWVNDADQKLYYDNAPAFILNPDNPDNYWYNKTMYETKRYNFNINYNPDLGNLNLWINAPVFDSSGASIGILGSGVDLTAFIKSIYKNYTNAADLYFFNAAEEITGARDPKPATHKMSISQLLGSAGIEILDSSKNLSESEIQNFRIKNKEIALGRVPALDWYITAIQPLSMKDYLMNDIFMFFLAFMGAIAIIFIIFNVFIVMKIFKA
jgi:methyl-accepting chemotaxis protein